MITLAIIYDQYTPAVEAQLTRDIIALKDKYPRADFCVVASTQEPTNILRAFSVPLVGSDGAVVDLTVVYKVLEFWPEHPDESMNTVIFRDLYVSDGSPTLDAEAYAPGYHVPLEQGRPIRDQLPLGRPAPRGRGMIDPAILMLWGGGPVMSSKVEAAFPHDVDHMPGQVHRQGPQAMPKTYSNKAQWVKDADAANRVFFDDDSEIATDNKTSQYVYGGKAWATWDIKTGRGRIESDVSLKKLAKQ